MSVFSLISAMALEDNIRNARSVITVQINLVVSIHNLYINVVQICAPVVLNGPSHLT